MKTERTDPINVQISFDTLLATLDQLDEDKLRMLEAEVTARFEKKRTI
jgi:hypothetical protein